MCLLIESLVCVLTRLRVCALSFQERANALTRQLVNFLFILGLFLCYFDDSRPDYLAVHGVSNVDLFNYRVLRFPVGGLDMRNSLMLVGVKRHAYRRDTLNPLFFQQPQRLPVNELNALQDRLHIWLFTKPRRSEVPSPSTIACR